MSRLGKKPIKIPAEVSIVLGAGEMTVKGPKGEIKRRMPPSVELVFDKEKNELSSSVADAENKDLRALWGLAVRLAQGMIAGVTTGFEKKLELVGIGFKVQQRENKLVLEVGFSHPVEFEPPEGITVKIDKNIITISGINKEMVGETAARIRRIKKPEPYKGKGIKYIDEVVRRKAGKAAKAGAK
ncbi:MAG: 50S ribosomal protein L6 [Patescibacteria group bacterium]